MAFLPRGVLALAMVTAMGSTGCWQLLGVTAEIITAAATSSSRSEPSRNRSDYYYSREGATPVEGPVDRPMSACELERGKWRETHQDQDEPPPRLRCLADGAYPKVPPPALNAMPAAPPPPPAPVEPPPPATDDLLAPPAPATDAPPPDPDML